MHSSSPDAWPPGHAWPDLAIAQLAATQRTMVTTAQLRQLGVRPRTIAGARARGRIHTVHRGVHSLVLPRARPPLAAEQAALLVIGPASVLSHHPAARVHGLRLPAPTPDVLHLTTTGPHRKGHPGLIVHRTQTLPAGEHHRVRGLPVTSVARTLVDLAPGYTDRALEPRVDQALRRTSRTKLLEAIDRHPGRPGTPRLAGLLDPARPSADAWSQAEGHLCAALARAGLPSPSQRCRSVATSPICSGGSSG